MFRKEMKKWQNILWIVLASLVLGTLYGIKFGPSRPGDVSVARVNGYAVTFDEYKKSLMEIQERINAIRQMAKAYGMSEEMFLQAYGFDNPQGLALDNCVQEKLYDYIKNQLGMRVDKQWFQEELLKSMPHLLDENGRVNINVYHDYLQRLSMTPAEFEARRAEEIKREILLKFVQHTAYVPGFVAKEAALLATARRAFSVVSCKLDAFMPEAKHLATDDKELNAFYLANKDRYKVSEQRNALYWEIDTKTFIDAMEIDQAIARQFYEKHKAAMYRIPPKVKVRRLVLKSIGAGLPSGATDVLKKAQEKPAQFQALVKQYSADEKTMQNGGIVDFFEKGTHDPEFEKAAFRLKEKGDVSPLIKTKAGYEIIQLVERINAGEKSFDVVKNDIVTTLKAKRAMGTLRSELEQVVRAAKNDTKQLDLFVAKHRCVGRHTDWLTENDTKAAGLQSLLAKKLFAAQGKTSGIGYFAHDDCYILYQVDEVRKAYVPTFNDVKAVVSGDFIKEQADVIAKRTLKMLRAAVLAGKKTLHDVATAVKGHYTKTDMATTAGDLKGFNGERSVKEKLLTLSDPSQVLFVSQGDNFYLARIEEIELAEKADLEKEGAKQAKSEHAKFGSLQMGAFIASLHRNAKIEVDNKNILEMQPVKE